MKQFRFSLETLLSLRLEAEKEKEIALAVATGEVATIDARIRELTAERERVFLAPAGDLNALRNRDLVWARTSQEENRLAQPRREAQKRLDQARTVFTQARRDRMALEKVKEKRYQQWRERRKREEILQLDETAKGAAARRRISGGDHEKL